MGNEEGAGAFEITASGPRLRFDAPAHVAVVGSAELRVDDRPVARCTVVPVEPGQEVSVGRTQDGLRCYLAVAGGLAVDLVLGSRSSDVLSGLGPGPLPPGDVIGIGNPARPRGHMTPPAPGTTPKILRVLPGPDDIGPDGVPRLADTDWEVGSDSDRMGVRLLGHEPAHRATPAVASRGTITGAVQIPPDGGPVVLLCDHATVGGYPVAATVVRADLGVLGQLRPGDAVRFELVDLGDARRALAAAQRSLDRAVVGWYPVRSD